MAAFWTAHCEELPPLWTDIELATIYNTRNLAIREGDHTLSNMYKRMMKSFRIETLCTIWSKTNAKDPDIINLGYQACVVIHMDSIADKHLQQWAVQYKPPFVLNITIVKANLTPTTGYCTYENITLKTTEQDTIAEICGFPPRLSFATQEVNSQIMINYQTKLANKHRGEFIIHTQRMISITRGRYVRITQSLDKGVRTRRFKMFPLHILITAEILYDIVMQMSSKTMQHSTGFLSLIPIKIMEGPLLASLHSYIDVPLDDTSVGYRTKTNIAWLHVTESLIGINLYLSFSFVRISDLSRPIPVDIPVGSNIRVQVKHGVDNTTCRTGTNAGIVFCFSHLGVSPGSYMRMTFSDLQNPGYYTQNCEYSGFAVVEPDRVRYIGEVGKLHMDHSLPVVTLCHSGYKKDGTPFPHTYTTFYSSIIIVYFAFLHNPTEAVKVQSTFSMNIHIERTLCAGYLMKCQEPHTLACTEIPPEVPMRRRRSFEAACSGRLRQFPGIPFYLFATRNYAEIKYLRMFKGHITPEIPLSRRSRETIHAQVYTDASCMDVQFLPSIKRGEICTLSIQTTAGGAQAGDMYKVHRYTKTKEADTCRKEKFQEMKGKKMKFFSGIDGCMHLSATVGLQCLSRFNKRGRRYILQCTCNSFNQK